MAQHGGPPGWREECDPAGRDLCYDGRSMPPSLTGSTIMLRFLGIILRVLRLEVNIYNVYFTNQFQTPFVRGGGGGGKIRRGDCE